MTQGTRPELDCARDVVRAQKTYAQLVANAGPIDDAAKISFAAFNVAWWSAGAGDDDTLATALGDAARWAGAGAAADQGEEVVLDGHVIPVGGGKVTPDLVLDGLAAATLARDELALERLGQLGLVENAHARAVASRAVVGVEAMWLPFVELYAAALWNEPFAEGLDAAARTAMSDLGTPLSRDAVAAVNLPLVSVIAAQLGDDEAAWRAEVMRAYEAHEAYTQRPTIRVLGVLSFPLHLCGLCVAAMKHLDWTPPVELPQILRNLIASPSHVIDVRR